MVLLVAAAVSLSLAGCNKEEQPTAEHPSVEKAASEHPTAEHPK